MKFAIIVFPGSNCDHDCHHVVSMMGHDAEFIWHNETDLRGAGCLILPGGFSYGDYLRSGAMAACSPVMDSVRRFAADGGLVVGICNGFQILQEAGLLPGALMRNKSLRFICHDVAVRVERDDSPFTCACRRGEVLRMPIAHMDGNFFMEKKMLSRLEADGNILFRYCSSEGVLDEDANPNGSMDFVAGVTNKDGNICGLMPHPERCGEALLGNTDGMKMFESIVAWNEKR